MLTVFFKFFGVTSMSGSFPESRAGPGGRVGRLCSDSGTPTDRLTAECSDKLLQDSLLLTTVSPSYSTVVTLYIFKNKGIVYDIMSIITIKIRFKARESGWVMGEV